MTKSELIGYQWYHPYYPDEKVEFKVVEEISPGWFKCEPTEKYHPDEEDYLDELPHHIVLEEHIIKRAQNLEELFGKGKDG